MLPHIQDRRHDRVLARLLQHCIGRDIRLLRAARSIWTTERSVASGALSSQLGLETS